MNTVQDLAKAMRAIDFAMLATHGPDGTIAARPMSNNRDVDYDGDSWFFTDETANMVDEIERDPKVSLVYQGHSGLIGQRPLFMTVEGTASLIRDKAQFAAHWTKDLERWWPDGVDTPGIVLIKVEGVRAHYWDGTDSGELILEGSAVG